MKSLAQYEADNAAIVARHRAEKDKARRSRARKVRKLVSEWVRSNLGGVIESADRALMKRLIEVVEEGR